MAATLLNTSYLFSDFQLKDLIGVSAGIEDHVLVTCKGVVKLYNVQDKKPIQNWTTKTWDPFTAAAVYDPSSSNITAVINHSYLSRWNEDEDDIDKVKRESFETPIHQLIVAGDVVYVVFTSGHVENLSTALKTRKKGKVGFLLKNEIITYAAIDEVTEFVLLTVKTESNHLKIWKIHLNGKVPPVSYVLPVRDVKINAICLLASRLFTLWSDGNMHCFNLATDAIEKLPGRHYAHVSAINVSKAATIVPITSSHMALVGADAKDEGGTIILWDVKFAMVTSRRRLKMYHSPPPAWSSSHGVIVVDGGSLSCTPYELEESTLATVFGSRISKDDEYPQETLYSWDEEKEDAMMGCIYGNKSERLIEILKELNQHSLSESVVVGTVVAPLIEKKELLLLHEVIIGFRDMPDKCLVDILQFYLQCKDSDFDGLMKYPDIPMEVALCKGDNEVVKSPFGVGKSCLINTLIAVPSTDSKLSTELQRLSFEDALHMLQHLYFMLAAGEVMLCPAKDAVCLSVEKVSEWMSLLLDTKYHQIIMTSQSDIHRLLLSCFTCITETRKTVQELFNMEPIIRKVVELEPNPEYCTDLSCSKYSIERLVLK